MFSNRLEFTEWVSKVSQHPSWSSNHPLFASSLKELFRSKIGSTKWEADFLYWLKDTPTNAYKIFKSLESKINMAQTFIDELDERLLSPIIKYTAAERNKAKQYLFLSMNNITEIELQADNLVIVADNFEKMATDNRRESLFWALFHPAASLVREKFDYKILSPRVMDLLKDYYVNFEKLLSILNAKNDVIPYAHYDWRIRQHWYGDIWLSYVRNAIVYTDWNIMYRNIDTVSSSLVSLEKMVNELKSTPYLLDASIKSSILVYLNLLTFNEIAASDPELLTILHGTYTKLDGLEEAEGLNDSLFAWSIKPGNTTTKFRRIINDVNNRTI